MLVLLGILVWKLPAAMPQDQGARAMAEWMFGCYATGVVGYFMIGEWLAGGRTVGKALLHLRDEVPHGIGVEMLAMKRHGDLMEIHATIYCERAAHKGIIIGKQGAMLRRIGQEAREDIEGLLGMRVNLQLWVKVRQDWRNGPEDLRTLGYEDKE